MSSQFSNYPLEGDGLIEHLFYYLWMKDELDQGPTINIPDTIVYKYRQPAFWYFTASNGQVKRKSKYNLLNAKIEETFTRNSRGCDIFAYYLTRGERPSDVTIEYLDKRGLHNFLYKREKTENGILQRFIEPKGIRNSLIRAIWSPKVCLLERRINVHNLQDTRHFSMYDRAVTYEGPDVNSETAPVRGSILPSQVQRTCQALVNHVAEVSFQKHRIKRLAGNFKVDPKDRVWFMWATSLRVEHTGELSPRSHKRLLREGLVPGAPVNIDALLSIPSNIRITTKIPKPGEPPISTTGKDLFDCPSCGRSVQPNFLHKVSYKTVVEHFGQLLSIMGAGSNMGGSYSSTSAVGIPSDGLAWPPDPEVVNALGGVGLGGARGPLGKSHHGHVPDEEDLVIPPVLRIAHPNMAAEEFRRYRRDPLFLYKSTSICEDCWLVYAETSGASTAAVSGSGGVSAALRSLAATRERNSRRLSPLSRRGKRSNGHRMRADREAQKEANRAAAAAARRRRREERRAASRASLEQSGGRSLGQLMTPGPSLPPRITLEDLGPDGLPLDGTGGSSVLEQIARQGDRNVGMGASRGSSMLSSAGSLLSRNGEPPPEQGVQAVPEAFRQTLQEREDAFFRELYQNPNLQRGHPLSHMVVGAAKIKAHQQQMAEFQQNLGAEFGGSGGISAQSRAPPSAASVKRKSKAVKGGGAEGEQERIMASPYARLQMINGPPPGKSTLSSSNSTSSQGGHGSVRSVGVRKKQVDGKKRKRKKGPRQSASMPQLSQGSQIGTVEDHMLDSLVGGAQLGNVTEEDMSASASAHRDFLLQTLRNVREQLANPSPLIIAGADEEGGHGAKEGEGSVDNGSSAGGSGFVSSSQSAVQSIMLPQVQEQDSSTSQSQFPNQGSRTDMRFLFDLVDEQHGGRLAKMDVLRAITSEARVRDLVENTPSLAGLLEPATWADELMAFGTQEEGVVTIAELESFAKNNS